MDYHFDTELKTVQEPKRELMYLLAPLIDWDPKDTDLEAKRELDHAAVCKVMREHFRSEGLEDRIKAETGESLVYACNRMPVINYHLYVGGYCTFDDLIEVWSMGLLETKGYGYVFISTPKPGKDITDDHICRASLRVQENIWHIRQTKEHEMKDREVKLPDDPSLLTGINTLLDKAELPNLEYLTSLIKQADNREEAVKKNLKTKEEELKATLESLAEVKGSVADLQTKVLAGGNQPKERKMDGDGNVPTGTSKIVKASEVWPDVDLPMDLTVTIYEWEEENLYVPEVDPHYVWRPELLLRLLYAQLTNKNLWAQGHTGSGKTTLIEQFCAITGTMFFRINLDSEISRPDFIGKTDLKAYTDPQTGQTVTVSEFVEGILPWALKYPGIICFDEIDFVRPDVAYVLQSVIEGKGMRLVEDGGRWIHPHPQFRVVATANTVGQGDEFGMYQGARPQSMAFLDRFPVFLKVPYMSAPERERLINRHFPAMSKDQVDRINQYTQEHIEAFTRGEVIQPISPRGMLALGMAMTILQSERTAVEMTILDKANEDDRAALDGIASRIFA